ncbi:MAG: hypothetical protein FJY92_00360, partial [Candidatus Hydrogenedentes bacterium]|nr:hypothetical protein [Candidatus Hydrogenedentota bacterium]
MRSIVDRLSDYFARQIALYRQMLAEQDQILALLDAGELDSAEALACKHARDSAALEREFDALLREWKSQPQTNADHAPARALAHEAAGLAGQLQEYVGIAAGSARKRREAVKREWEAIRRGQNVLDRYRTIESRE